MAATRSFGSATGKMPGSEAIESKGFLRAHRWLILRRLSQFGIFALFLAGPLAGIWLIKGNLSASLTLDMVPLTDLFVLLQSLTAGHLPATSALLGAAIVAVIYLLLGGRVFCAWACPMNVVTDSAAWLRRRLGIKGGSAPARSTRLWLLGFILLACLLTGSMVWEFVNPVSLLQRGLIFGIGIALLPAVGIFLYDLFVAQHGWCGHLCPMGACYSLLGHGALVRVAASGRSRCTDCMDCFSVCPEPQVIRPALKGSGSALILAADCSNCGRCIDVCSQDVFRMTHRFDKRRDEA